MTDEDFPYFRIRPFWNHSNTTLAFEHAWNIVMRLTTSYNIPPGLLMRGSKRTNVVRCREAIIAEMLRTLSGAKGKPMRAYPEGRPEDVKPISTPMIAEWLGMDHSSIVVARQRVEKRAAVNPAIPEDSESVRQTD